jgi:hypothetical protein
LKEDNIKYTVCTEGSDSNFHYLRVMLISLLKHNPWVGRDITIFTCDETPLSRHNRTILESICKNIKFHDIDPNIYASLNIRGVIRKSILPLLYKIEAFNLTENDIVLYVNSSSLCISSLDFVFSGKSEAMVANTGYMSQDKRSPDPRKLKVDEFNTSLLLLSKSVLLENISSHIMYRLSRIKGLTDRIIEKEIIDSLKIREIEIGYFDLNRVIKKSRYTDSKYNNFLSIKKNVGLIQLDVNFSRKNDSSRLMYRKIDAIWQSYNQQGEWSTEESLNGLSKVADYAKIISNIHKTRSINIAPIKIDNLNHIKNVIIIGASSTVLNEKFGEKIDKFDIVIRINDFRIYGYEEYVGTKTNYVMTSYATDFNTREYRSIVSDKVIMGLADKFNNIKFLRSRIKKFKLDEIKILPEYYYIPFMKEIKSTKPCSAGTVAIKWALDTFKESDIYIHGIDLNTKYNKYYVTSSNKLMTWKKSINKYHDFYMENKYITNLLKNKIINKLVK